MRTAAVNPANPVNQPPLRLTPDGTTYHVLDFRYILESKEGEKKVTIEDNGGRVIAVASRANSKLVD